MSTTSDNAFEKLPRGGNRRHKDTPLLADEKSDKLKSAAVAAVVAAIILVGGWLIVAGVF